MEFEGRLEEVRARRMSASEKTNQLCVDPRERSVWDLMSRRVCWSDLFL